MKIVPIRNTFNPAGIALKPVSFRGFDSYEEFAAQKPDFELYGPSANAVLASTVHKRPNTGNIEREIKEVLNFCNYGKIGVLDNPEHLRFEEKNNEVYLKGFLSKDDTNGRLDGVCQELAYKAGTILEKKFKDKYNILTAFTEGTRYEFGGHSCVLMVPKNDRTDTIVKIRGGISDIHKKQQKLRAKIEKHPENTALYEDLSALHNKERAEKEKLDHYMGDGDFLEDSIFVDPSLKSAYRWDDIPLDYKFTGFNTLEGANPYEEPQGLIIEPYEVMPVGYTKDVLPEKEDSKGKDTIMGFVLLMDGHFHACEFGNGVDNLIKRKTLAKKYPDSKFTAFIKKLNKELEEFKRQAQ